jgi:hypothetical protein
LFGFNVIVVICLQSIHTSSDEYILEFFLPPICVDNQEQEVVLNSLVEGDPQIVNLKSLNGVEIEELGSS